MPEPKDKEKKDDKGANTEPVTLEQVQGLITTSITEGLAAFSKAMKFDKLPDIIKAAVAEHMPKPKEKTDDDADEDDNGGKGKSKEKPSDDPTVRKLQEDLEKTQRLAAKLGKQVEESERKQQESASKAEQTERFSAIRTSLQNAGANPKKIELAFRAVKDDVVRTEDGALIVKGVGKDKEDQPLDTFVAGFLKDNPEFLPPRGVTGSGQQQGGEQHRQGEVDSDSIKPGMSEKDQASAAAAILQHMPRPRI